MKLLDKYILSKFLKTYVFVVGILVVVIMVIDFTEKNEKYIKNDVPAEAIIQYYLAFAPWIANLISPITVFITTVLVTSGMAVKTEIVAILSGGVSFRRMLVPYLIGASLVACVSFYANGWLIPNSEKYRIGFEIEYLKKPFYFNERDIHLKVAENDYIYIQRYNNRTESAYRVTMERIVDNRLEAKLFAKKMTWNDSLQTWRFRNWEKRELKSFGEMMTKGENLDSAFNLSPDDFDTKYQLNATMNMDELDEYIALLKSRGSSEVGLYEIEKYIRYMLPFTAIILTLMGVSVSAEKSTRGGAGFKIALGFVIAFVFILLFVLVKAIAEAGSMHPILAIWIPNIVGLVAALVMYRFVPK